MTKIMMLSIALISLLSICRCEGFTFDLIHRDSHESPSFNPSSTPYQRLAGSLHRSHHRAKVLYGKSPPQPDIVNSLGEYFLKYSVGTPPIPSLGTVDTASDLSWTQCQPCIKCFKQSLPLFTPAKSSTFKRVLCGSPQCSFFQGTTCSKTGKGCKYSETYVDGSFSDGSLATDTITLAAARGGVVSVPNFVFGCGNNNGDDFPGGQSGIVGLGGGKGSLVGQLGPLANGKFSYCLVPLSASRNSSKLKFGESGGGRGTVWTAMVKKIPDTFYYVTLEGISVGNQRLKMDVEEMADSKAGVEGNMIVDSGTTVTLLPPDLYSKLEKAMRSLIKVKIVADPNGLLGLCYGSKRDFRVPDVTVHFRGADVKLARDNVFVRISEDTVCLAAAPVKGDALAIYGNLWQTNFLVGYDLVKRTVSFKVADCEKI